MLLGHYENGSAEWLAARAGIGGSDIGTICGVNPYKSRDELIAERLNPDHTPITPSMPMRLGTVFEAPIRQIWAEDNWLEATVHETGTWQSLENPFWKANPDGIIRWVNGELSIMEIKFSQAANLVESWRYQVTWYMSLLGLNHALIVQCRGNKIIEHNIKADRLLIDEMRHQAALFERELQNG
jgi:predicted phage-related endonuclease